MKKRNNSIVQKEMDRCFVCGSPYNLHVHEIFYGSANRVKSIEHGLYVRLCGHHHNMSNHGVHFNKKLNSDLQDYAQRKFEELHSHEEFMEIFHKNYLKD